MELNIRSKLLASFLFSTLCFSQSMKIHTRSGVTEFNLVDIDSITFFVGMTHNDSDITTALSLYFPFDGNTADVSGNGNNGSSSGALFTADKWGNPNSAYLFNGMSNFITVPNSPSLNPTDQLTITMWIRADSLLDNYMDILVKGGIATANYSNREYALYTKQHVPPYYYFELKSAGDGSGQHEMESYFYPVPGQWVFIAAVVDRKNHLMQFYSDGVLTNQVGDSYSTFNVNSSFLIIGWSEEGLSQVAPFKGAMDNLRIYTRALTASQIQFLYNSRK